MSRPQKMQEGDRCGGPSYGRATTILLLILLSSPTHSQTVIDADTLRMEGKTYRLHGIDAPELDQTCFNGWLAGAYAAGVLRGMADRGGVICIPKTTDRYGRVVAVCWVDGVDIGAELVRQGLAWSYTRYSRDYALQEHYAKAAGLGVHGAGCIPAWLHRKEKR